MGFWFLGVYVFLLQQIVALPSVSHPVVVFGLYGVGAIAGAVIGSAISPRLQQLAVRVAPVSQGFSVALGVLLASALLSAIGWSYLWNAPVAGLCVLGSYVVCGLVYRTQRWPFGNAVMDGVFCGFLLSLVGVALGLDPAVI